MQQLMTKGKEEVKIISGHITYQFRLCPNKTEVADNVTNKGSMKQPPRLLAT